MYLCKLQHMEEGEISVFKASHLNLALLANFMKQREGLGDKVGRGVVSTFTTLSVTMSVFWALILDKDCQG